MKVKVDGRHKDARKKIIMPSKKIRTGDQVMALTGNNKGQTGTVLAVKENRVIVQGLNVRKKHVKPSEHNPKGGIVEHEKGIHISNLRVCVDGNPVKLKVRTSEAGSKELYYMDGENAVAYRTLKK